MLCTLFCRKATFEASCAKSEITDASLGKASVRTVCHAPLSHEWADGYEG